MVVRFTQNGNEFRTERGAVLFRAKNKPNTPKEAEVSLKEFVLWAQDRGLKITKAV